MINDIVRRLIENHRLDEMAISKSEAIASCMQLGTEFYEHFHKVYVGGIEDVDFKHHCKEMYNWYNSVRKIVLKSNKKPINNDQIYRWFFLAGSESYILFQDTNEVDAYEEFIQKLLSGDDRMFSDIIEDILR